MIEPMMTQIIKGKRPKLTELQFKKVKKEIEKYVGFNLGEDTWKQVRLDCGLKVEFV